MNALFWTALAAAVAALPFVARRPVYGLYGAFALGGILMMPSLPLVGDRLAIADLLIVAAIVFAAAAVWRARDRAGLVRAPAVRCALVFAALIVAWSALAALSGVLRFDADPRRSILSVVNYAYGALMLAAVLVLVDDWRKWRICLAAWVAGAAVVGLFAATAMLGIGPEWALPERGSRVMSTMRRINQVHSFSAPAMAIAFAWFFSRQSPPWWRIVSAFVFVLSAVALVATGARTALILLLMVLAGVVLYALRYARRSPVVAGVAVALVVAGAAGVGGLAGVVARGEVRSLPRPLQTAARPVQLLIEAEDFDSLFGARSPLMRTAAEEWSRYPLFGVGPANFRDYYEQTHELHNTYLGVLMEHGVPGFLVLVAFIVAVLWAAVGAARSAGRGAAERVPAGVPPGGAVFTAMLVFAFILILVYGLSTFGLRQRVFWLTAGLLLSTARIVAEGTTTIGTPEDA